MGKEIEEKRKLEERQLEASIPTIEAIKHLNAAFIANAQSSNVNAVQMVECIKKDTRQMEMEENQIQNLSPSTSSSLRTEQPELDPDDEKISRVAHELSEELNIDEEIIKTLLSENDTKERNKVFKKHKIPKEIKEEIIEGRRRLKNRGYAKDKRSRDDTLMEELTAAINEKLESIKANQVATVATKMKGKEYQARALQLSKELEEMERNIHSLQENRRHQRTAQE